MGNYNSDRELNNLAKFIFISSILSAQLVTDANAEKCEILNSEPESPLTKIVERLTFHVYLNPGPSFEKISFDLKIKPHIGSGTFFSELPIEITKEDLKVGTKSDEPNWIRIRVKAFTAKKSFAQDTFTITAQLEDGRTYESDTKYWWRFNEKQAIAISIEGGAHLTFSCIPIHEVDDTSGWKTLYIWSTVGLATLLIVLLVLCSLALYWKKRRRNESSRIMDNLEYHQSIHDRSQQTNLPVTNKSHLYPDPSIAGSYATPPPPPYTPMDEHKASKISGFTNHSSFDETSSSTISYPEKGKHQVQYAYDAETLRKIPQPTYPQEGAGRGIYDMPRQCRKWLSKKISRHPDQETYDHVPKRSQICKNHGNQYTNENHYVSFSKEDSNYEGGESKAIYDVPQQYGSNIEIPDHYAKDVSYHHDRIWKGDNNAQFSQFHETYSYPSNNSEVNGNSSIYDAPRSQMEHAFIDVIPESNLYSVPSNVACDRVQSGPYLPMK